ncbi:MAG: ComF family protein [Tepidisphaeraceae bacterium]
MWVARLVKHVLDFCYPGACAACESSCDGSTFLCPACDAQLLVLERAPACDHCAMPLGQEGAPCPYCEGKGVPHYDRVVRLGVFDDPLRHLIHQLKYHRRWPLAEFLADRLMGQERARGILTQTQVLVPIPLHRLRQVARGYNQADVVARRIGKRCGIPVARPIVRLRQTETQTHLHSRKQREQNLRGAFALIDPKPVAGRHVVVIDDVTTTGATLQAFARALVPARPASLCAMAVALADPLGRDFQAM